jgi:hypothetical protein
LKRLVLLWNARHSLIDHVLQLLRQRPLVLIFITLVPSRLMAAAAVHPPMEAVLCDLLHQLVAFEASSSVTGEA